MASTSRVVLAIVVFFSLIPLSYADRCILPIADVDVYGPGQKAIVAWNGEVERLILSTDLYASTDTKVLEVLPLPSEPNVEEGSFESFQAVQELMMKNMPRAVASEYKAGLEIVFHTKIGAHDITVVKAMSVDELSRFILDYTRKMGVAQPGIMEDARLILSDYLARGFNYWVFDLVDLYSTARSIEPIIYQFQSPSLYYPMKVSATAKGATEIILYLITPEQIGESVLPSKMRLARYLPSDRPIQFQVTHEELAMIDKEVASLFGPIPLVYPPFPTAWLTAVRYEGDLSDIDFDLEIPPRKTTCRSIKVTTDKAQYDLGETAKITVNFVHLLPGCAEIMVVHSHQIRLEVLDSKGEIVRSWQWQTDGDLRKTMSWKPEKAGDYTIGASSWWSGHGLEVEDQTVLTVSATTSTFSQEIRWLLYGIIIAVVCISVGAAVTYLLLRPRPAK